MLQVLDERHLQNAAALASRHRSFCMFEATTDFQAQLIQALQETTQCRVASLDALPPLNSSHPNGLLITDADWPTAAAKGAELYQLLVNLTQDRVPLWLVARDAYSAWVPTSLWLPQGRELNNDGERGFEYIDRNQIRAYQFLNELKRHGPVFSSPAMLGFAEVDPPLSHIERILAKAMAENGLRFQAGAKIGPFHADFLVTAGDKQVIVECDGMTFHSGPDRQRRDRARDEKVRELGFDTLRFTSHQIMRNAALCALTISSHLRGTKPPLVDKAAIDLGLDASQQTAVMAEEGSTRLLAPAGAGKTKTLTNRICQLVNMGHAPNRILALAFNKKARIEMQDRLQKLAMDQVNVFTFHALGLRICTQYHRIKWTADEDKHSVDKKIADKLFDLLSHHVAPLKKDRNRITLLMAAYNRIKDTLDHPYEQFSGVVTKLAATSTPLDDMPPREAPVWQHIFETTFTFQVERSLYTFADMIYVAVRRLAENPAALEEVHSLWDSILVDEFQDLNPAQLYLVDLLASRTNSLMVVGDDDQMIYSWRGANVDFIRYFSQLFPGSDSKTLSTNYRCAKRLVRHADYLVRHNVLRIPKDIQAGPFSPNGEIEFRAAFSLHEEIEHVVRYIKAQRDKGLAWSDIGVISRYKQSLEPLIQRLRASEIPYYADSGRFFSTPAASTLLSYLSAVVHWPKPPNQAWNDILKVPNRFIPFGFITTVVGSHDPVDLLRTTEELSAGAKREVFKLLGQLAELNKACEGKSTLEIIEALDAAFGLTDYFTEKVEQGDDNDSADGGLVLEGIKYHATSRPIPLEFLDYCNLQVLEEGSQKESTSTTTLEDKVAVLSIHTSKGKEWKSVVVFHGEDRKAGRDKKPRHLDLQQWKTEQQKHAEEERRVYYVAVTRPKTSILLTAMVGNVTGYFVEYLKHPELAPFTDEALARELGARRGMLARTHQHKGLLEQQLQVAEQTADEDRTRVLLAPYKATIEAKRPVWEPKRSALQSAKADWGLLTRNQSWDDLQRLQTLRQAVPFSLEVDRDAAALRESKELSEKAKKALAAQSVFNEIQARNVWTDKERMSFLEDALGLKLMAQAKVLRDKEEARSDLETSLVRAKEDLARLQGNRPLISKLQATFGLRPAAEAECSERIQSAEEGLIRIRREEEDTTKALRKVIVQAFEDIESQSKQHDREIKRLESQIESAIRKELDAWEVETNKLGTIVQEAEAASARIKAAQEQAVRDAERLLKEISLAERDIARMAEQVYEAEFEQTVRAELDKQVVVDELLDSPPIPPSQPEESETTSSAERQRKRRPRGPRRELPPELPSSGPLAKMTPYELGESGQLEALPYLIQYLAKGSSNDRKLAASAVCKLAKRHRGGCDEAAPYLVDALDDAGPQTRQYVLGALREVTVPASAFDHIREIANTDEKEYNREAASRLLKQCGEPLR